MDFKTVTPRPNTYVIFLHKLDQDMSNLVISIVETVWSKYVGLGQAGHRVIFYIKIHFSTSSCRVRIKNFNECPTVHFACQILQNSLLCSLMENLNNLH